MYEILPYSYVRAEQLGVKIIPSIYPRKKIDVLDYHNNYICSIGQAGMMDFPHYAKQYGLEYALDRRPLNKSRHKHEPDRLGSPIYYSRRLLW
jgi:hypothetical protein